MKLEVGDKVRIVRGSYCNEPGIVRSISRPRDVEHDGKVVHLHGFVNVKLTGPGWRVEVAYLYETAEQKVEVV